MEGTDIYVAEDMEQYLLDGVYGNNALFATILSKVRPQKEIPFIQEAKIQMTGYNSLNIKVKEKQMIGYLVLKDGGYAYFDEEGRVVEISDRLLPDRILISGVTPDKNKVGETIGLEEKQLTFLTALLKALVKYDIPVSAGIVDPNGNISVLYGTILINVGDQNYLEEKIMRLPHILPRLEGQTGTLHLENWSEDNTDIVFEKQM